VSIVAEHLSCQELVELVTSYFEGALPAPERARFEAHLTTCDGCDRYLEQMRATIIITGSLQPANVAPEAERKLLAAFADWKSS
jgi:anti-sigma factor RsiW